jgi:hypothetical protein
VLCSESSRAFAALANVPSTYEQRNNFELVINLCINKESTVIIFLHTFMAHLRAHFTPFLNAVVHEQ